MSNLNNCVKCSINSCKHHNDLNYCELGEISIGGEKDSKTYSTTACQSFCLKDC